MSLTATARSIPGTLRQEVVIGGQHRLMSKEMRDVDVQYGMSDGAGASYDKLEEMLVGR